MTTPPNKRLDKEEEKNFNNWDRNTALKKKQGGGAVEVRKEIKAFVYVDAFLSPKMSPRSVTHRNQTLKIYSVHLQFHWTLETWWHCLNIQYIMLTLFLTIPLSPSGAHGSRTPVCHQVCRHRCNKHTPCLKLLQLWPSELPLVYKGQGLNQLVQDLERSVTPSPEEIWDYQSRENSRLLITSTSISINANGSISPHFL